MFLETQETPNPHTLKFIPHRDVRGTMPPVFYATQAEASASPLALLLFGVEGVKSIYLGVDFLSITKQDDADWKMIKPFVLHAIADAFLRGIPVYYDHSDQEGDFGAVASAQELLATEHYQTASPEQKKLMLQIVETLDLYIRPGVAKDGGDIRFVRLDDGIVSLMMQGACKGCPSSKGTLKKFVETTLQYYIPQVVEVREAHDHDHA